MRNRFRLPKIANFPPTTITELAKARNSDIIFQGHGLVDEFLRDAFRSWNTQASVTANVQQSTLANSTSQTMWDNSTTADGVDSRAYLVSPGVDIFVYAETPFLNATTGTLASPAMPLDYGDRWTQLAWTNSAKPFLYATWPTTLTGTDPYQTTTGLSNGDVAPTMAWRPKLDYMRQHYEAIIGRCEAGRPANAPRFRLIPADRLMATLYDLALAGNLTGVAATQSAFFTKMFSDDINLTNYGKYAIACLHYACIYQRSPIGLSTNWTDIAEAAYTGMPTAAEALQLQQVAISVAARDPLSMWGQQQPVDPYFGQTATPDPAAWFTPADPILVVPNGPPWGFAACTLAWSYRYTAGQLDSPPTLYIIHTDQYTRIAISGHPDGTGRKVSMVGTTSGWGSIDFTETGVTQHRIFPASTNNFVLVFDEAGGLSGGNTGQLWHNGELVLTSNTSVSDIALALCYFMGDQNGTNQIPGETQGYWLSNDTAVSPATLFADLFDGTNGMLDLASPVIAGVTPDAYQFGPP